MSPKRLATSAEPLALTSTGFRRRAPSWQQVEEMISHLIDPITGKVRGALGWRQTPVLCLLTDVNSSYAPTGVYRDVLSFLPDEEVLAVYPEKAHRTRSALPIRPDCHATCEQSEDRYHMWLGLLSGPQVKDFYILISLS